MNGLAQHQHKVERCRSLGLNVSLHRVPVRLVVAVVEVVVVAAAWLEITARRVPKSSWRDAKVSIDPKECSKSADNVDAANEHI